MPASLRSAFEGRYRGRILIGGRIAWDEMREELGGRGRESCETRDGAQLAGAVFVLAVTLK
jgi:hypothetical protein